MDFSYLSNREEAEAKQSLDNLKTRDVVEFKSMLLNKTEKDLGVIEEGPIVEDGETLYKVVPLTLKVSYKIISSNEILRKVGRFEDFDFAVGEESHKLKVGFKFKLKLDDEFFRRYVEEIGYAYWNTAKEMKSSFRGLDEIECTVEKLLENGMYHIFTDIHDLRINDKFIDEFGIYFGKIL